MTEEPVRILWVDLIRVVAVFAVIVLHVAAVPVVQFGTIARDHWWWANAFDSLARPCVPLFIMASGALLLTKEPEGLSHFMRKRIARVAIPFIAWSAIYAGWNYVFHAQSITLGEFIHHLVSGMTDPVYTHLWYLPLILSLYLLLPIFRIYVAKSTLANQSYFCCLWVAATIIQPLLESKGVTIGYYLQPLWGYIGYFVLGATFRLYAPKEISVRALSLFIITFAAGYVTTVWGTYFLTAQNDGRLDEYFYSNLSPGVIAMTIAAFALLRHLGGRLNQGAKQSAYLSRFVAFAAPASFGIYLVHMIILELLNSGVLGFALGPSNLHPALAVPASSIVTFLASLALSTLMRKSRVFLWLVA